MKIMTLLISFLLLTFVSVAYGITVVGPGPSAKKNFARSSKIIQDDRMLLLSWQGDYLRTTKGTVYVADIDINNFTGLKKKELNRSIESFEVQIIRNGNGIARIDIIKAD